MTFISNWREILFMSSAGISIKDIMHGAGYDNSGQNPSALKQSVDEANRNDCFYGMCTKSTYCGGVVVCGKFRSRRHQVFCFFLTTMVVALFLAVIIPLVSKPPNFVCLLCDLFMSGAVQISRRQHQQPGGDRLPECH